MNFSTSNSSTLDCLVYIALTWRKGKTEKKIDIILNVNKYGNRSMSVRSNVPRVDGMPLYINGTEFCRYIGKEDIAGNCIYENDVVEFNINDGERKTKVGYVTYYKEECAFMIATKNRHLYYIWAVSNLLVVGNILEKEGIEKVSNSEDD